MSTRINGAIKASKIEALRKADTFYNMFGPQYQEFVEEVKNVLNFIRFLLDSSIPTRI
jgi:hypothetical protein